MLPLRSCGSKVPWWLYTSFLLLAYIGRRYTNSVRSKDMGQRRLLHHTGTRHIDPGDLSLACLLSELWWGSWLVFLLLLNPKSPSPSRWNRRWDCNVACRSNTPPCIVHIKWYACSFTLPVLLVFLPATLTYTDDRSSDQQDITTQLRRWKGSSQV